MLGASTETPATGEGSVPAGKAVDNPHGQARTSQLPVAARWQVGECHGRSTGPHGSKWEPKQSNALLLLQKQPSQKPAKANGNYGPNQRNKCCFSCLSAVNWTLLAAWQQGSIAAPDT